MGAFRWGTAGSIVVAAVLLGGAVAPAGAWPIPLTSVDQRFLTAVRGDFPGDDDQLLTAGRQACYFLYSGSHVPEVNDALSANYGATPDQTTRLIRAARNAYCTQAPG